MVEADRGRRRGGEWWCALPDLDAAAAVAQTLAVQASDVGITVAHGSGRPWLFGQVGAGMFRTVVVGSTRIAMLGTCLTRDADLRKQVESRVTQGDIEALAGLPGSYHLLASGPDGMLVFSDVAGFRRVFTCRAGGITVASSHADVLRRLINAPVSHVWLAARLASPEMPNPLRESLSPFDGIGAIPAGHRLTVRGHAARHAPYWTPPPATTPLTDGAAVFADALTGAVAGRVRAAGGTVSVQLSGGLDSTAVSCLAAEGLQDRSALLLVTTASVAPGNDDLVWARRVAEHLASAEHRVVDAHELPLFFDDLPTTANGMANGMVGGLDEPAPFTAAAARVRHVAALLAARGVQVHLNGQGGDEVLLAPLAYLRDAFRASPRLGWRHLRGQAALRDLHLPRLARAVLAEPSYARWLRWASQHLRTEARAEADAAGWEAQPLLPRWASRDTGHLLRAAILDVPQTPLAEHGTHAALVRIRSTAYRAALYRDTLASHGVPAEFPFFDRAVIEAALAVHPWERTDPWQPKPLLRAALANTVPARLLARRTKAHYNDDIYRGWTANRQKLAALFDNSRLADLGLIDAGMLHTCLRSFGPSGMAPAFLTDTIACEVWLRSLAPPFTHHREATHVRTQHERCAGQGRVEHAGGRRPDVAG